LLGNELLPIPKHATGEPAETGPEAIKSFRISGLKHRFFNLFNKLAATVR
jgi:hypothetical protein